MVALSEIQDAKAHGLTQSPHPPPGYRPSVLPKATASLLGQYDKAMYKRRNEIERLFQRLKGFRTGFSSSDMLDKDVLGFFSIVLIVEAFRLCS